MKRGGAISSALGMMVMAAFLMRGGAAPERVSQSQSVVASHPGRENRAPEAGVASTSRKLPEDGPWRASRDHFSGIDLNLDCLPDQIVQPEETASRYTLSKTVSLEHDGGLIPIQHARADLWRVPRCESVEAMIAIVPDPVHTHLALAFDRTIEALQLAAESGNYVVDRYWLPWGNEIKNDWTDFDSYRKDLQARHAKEEQPGLLIFRWNGQRGEARANLLYVFLVADTSTFGIDGRQFSNAVEYVRQVCDNADGCPSSDHVRRVHVMGPTFSGSLASLRNLTDGAGAPKFKVYSGTVSSLCAMQTQQLAVAKRGLCPVADYTGELAEGIDFRSFVSSSEISIHRFIEFLQSSNGVFCRPGHPEVAILSEAATTYGAAQRPSGRYDSRLQEAAPQEGPLLPENDANKAVLSPAGTADTTASEETCYTGFSYPREISSLRNAYHATGADSVVSGTRTSDAGRPYLSFNLNDEQANSDEPPDLSRQQSPLSKEAVLMKMAAELRNNRYKYIGIIGTNGLDVLFLSSFLRSAYPDARVFLINSDLMFERELDNASFIGTLSISTYPLVARNLDWTTRGWPSPVRQLDRLPFSDQFEEGQYNATLALIEDMVPYLTAPGSYEMPAASPVKFEEMPVWLTVVGNGGYWPVKLLPSIESGKPVASPLRIDPVLRKEDFSLAWRGIEVLLCTLALLHVLILWTASPIASRFRDFAMVTSLPAQRLFFIHVGSGCLVLTLAMMAAPAWWFSAHDDLGVEMISIVAALTIMALVLTCGCLHINYVLRWKWEQGQNGGSPASEVLRWSAVHALMWVIPLVAGALWMRLFRDDPSHYGFFFAYRAVHLATGVSPLMPMLPLLAAGYLWSVFEIWRLRFNEEFRPRLGPVDLPESPANEKPVRAAAPEAHAKNAGTGPVAVIPGGLYERPVADAVLRYLLAPRFLLAAVVVYLLWLLFFDIRRPFLLFEAPTFGRIYEFFFCIVVAMMLTAGFRVGQIWSEMRKLLGELERSPLRFTFRRLKDGNWSPIWRQGGEQAIWVNMARSFEAMDRLKNAGRGVDRHLQKKIEGLQSQAEEIRQISQSLQEEKFDSPVLRATASYWETIRPKKKGAPVIESFSEIERKFRELQQSLAGLLHDALQALYRRWAQPGCMPEEESTGGPEGQGAPLQKEKSETAKSQARQTAFLEEFVALRYEAFIRAVLGHIQRLLIFLAVSFSLVLISLNVYSFEPHKSLIWSLTVIFVVLGVIVVGALMQVHRDHILSRMTGTKPNELGLEFYVRIVSFGAAPLLTLLATHFPSIGRALVSFLQPGLEALK